MRFSISVVMSASVLPESRSMFAESNSNSAEPVEEVETLSPAITGVFSVTATQSPESPRCVETSPRNKLTRATLCAGPDCCWSV